jgi:hypothetical protein
MRGLGIAALLSALAAFVLWLAGWVYWNFLLTTLGAQPATRYAATACSVLSAFFQLLAVVLLSVAVVIAGKRLQKN